MPQLPARFGTTTAFRRAGTDQVALHLSARPPSSAIISRKERAETPSGTSQRAIFLTTSEGSEGAANPNVLIALHLWYSSLCVFIEGWRCERMRDSKVRAARPGRDFPVRTSVGERDGDSGPGHEGI
jgi:hypothetical protein